MGKTLSSFYGSEKVVALQKARDAQVASLIDQPGAVVHARIFSTDDPEALGWDRLRAVMAEEGNLTLRGVDQTVVDRACRELSDFKPVLHYWDLFNADASTIRHVCSPLVKTPLPDGLWRVAASDLSWDLVHEVQSFLTEQGVSPFSKDALLGRLFPAKVEVFRRADGRVAAAGFAAMTHNRFSPFHRIAWVGLIGVDPELRGIGLGKLIDAVCNLAAVNELGAAGTMEFVAQDNAPSRAMLESCGLKQAKGQLVAMLSTSTDRITR